MFTKNFKELDKNDAPIAGGKGASLGEMTRAEIPVPPGFVVLSDAFEKFLSETDLTVEIEALLGTVDNQKMHTVENASEKIQELILDAKMPEDIIKEIEIEFKKLDTKYVAVRSSATAEDGAEHAWAGQLNSYLNTTKENLLENIQKCWASLFTPRAIFYRFEKYSAQSPSPIGRGVRGEGGKKEVQYGDEKISVAVVIQKMIQSEKSGIAFSVHPVTEDYNQLIIEAGFGLGEAIVSGSITPDSYVVDKSRIKNEELRIKNEELRNKEAIIDVNVNIQNKGLYRSCHLARRGEGGISGNEWRDIPEPQSSSQVLSEKEILELSDLIIKIENHYGFPCDIEWAEENGKFYITQSRPITTLKSFDKDNIKKENEGTEIILSNAQSREHSLFYAYVWTESDQNNIKKYSGKTVKNLLFKREFNDPRLHVFYDSGEMQNIMQDIADNFRKNENLFEKIERDIQIQSEKMLLYINNVKKIKNIDELMEFKSEWLEWWSAMAMIFIIPNIDGISNDIHKKALAIRGKIEKYSDDIDRIFVNFFKTKYPRSVDLVNVITPEELFNFENLSNKEIDKIKLRKNGFALFNGNILTLNELGEDLKLKNIILEKMEITSGIEEISGICAYSGTVHGKIRKIILKNDISKIKKGEILLTHMTSPDFLSAFKKAIAVITDEGGATCHAAITSRELKKPCIVGTKIATQVLKDGDLVEVDADEAVVRILKRADENVKEVDVLKSTKDTVFSKQITYTFIPVICFESAIRSYHNNPLQKKLKIKNFPKIVEILTDKFEGWDDQNIQKITKAEDIKFVIQESRSIIIQYKASLQKFLQLDYIQLSNHDLLQNVKLLDEICMEVYQRYIFFIHEFFETDDSEMIELLPKVRIELSEFVSDIYKCCDYIIEALAKRFDSVSWQTFTYATFDEIIDLLDDPQKIDEFKKISGRSIAFIYNGKDLATIKKKELVVEIINYLTNQEIVASGNCKIIKGNAVSGGTAKGLVIKILEYDYEKINDALSGKSDYILVTPMTRPEIVSYLKDAKAIITDEGGITCHAAIVSRELKIPCIVGTKIATQVLKDGDLVEVDADRGVVKILKKIEINNSEKEKYVKIFNRSLFLIGCQNYDLGERVETKKITPVKYFMNPVFNNLPKKGTDVFYNFTDPAQNPKWIVDYFNNNRDQLLKIKETYYRDSDLLNL
ncbi:MAG: PEP-utilizing enzyme, mobile domain protein [Candidatus Moranbacteria bacterium GW2011_GWF2_34_56]|nr:MAG: PEP-utilizing enzyme, mobile domain protein [Candidatus Moranbacteria bacterium GW2011_GWF2_34_56]